jgi:hypothetical protein
MLAFAHCFNYCLFYGSVNKDTGGRKSKAFLDLYPAPDYNAARQELKDVEGEILAKQQAVQTLLHLTLNTGLTKGTGSQDFRLIFFYFLHIHNHKIGRFNIWQRHLIL